MNVLAFCMLYTQSPSCCSLTCQSCDGTDGEVIDASDGPCLNDITNSTVDHAEDCSTITSDSTQTEANDDEVLSPIVNQKGDSTL